ncbi:MAG: acylphosphatase [Candidatus Pacebacteria bacterium]|nr:acylphosphatase [Candidatus Paceibacterota bacterium]
MRKRLRVIYSGMVQGVGFRFTVERIARDLMVLGWVRNLGDGRVEIVAEAGEESLKELLKRVDTHFQRNIKDVQVDWLEAKSEFSDFGVKF